MNDIKGIKRIEIKIIEPYINDYKPDYDFPTAGQTKPILHYGECKNILEKAKDVTLDNVLDGLVAFMYTKQLPEIVIDIEGRNKLYAPPKEMTVEEIEEALGYKVKIVGEK